MAESYLRQHLLEADFEALSNLEKGDVSGMALLGDGILVLDEKIVRKTPGIIFNGFLSRSGSLLFDDLEVCRVKIDATVPSALNKHLRTTVCGKPLTSLKVPFLIEAWPHNT